MSIHAPILMQYSLDMMIMVTLIELSFVLQQPQR